MDAVPTKPELETSIECPPPKHHIHNTLTEPTTERVNIGSNGLLHFHKKQVVATAWIIAAGPKIFLWATFIMEKVGLHTSHCIELEGIFCSLHHLDYLNMTPKMVEQWCNNEQVVKDVTTAPDSPGGMMKTDRHHSSHPPPKELTPLPHKNITHIRPPRHQETTTNMQH